MTEPTEPGSDEAPLTPELTSDPTDHGKVKDEPERAAESRKPDTDDEQKR